MCGITGYWSDDRRAREALPAMTAALAHRGPDADGFHFDGPVGLGHRRLSVIDLAGSRQPLLSADGAIAVVFNGEIYNFRELRRELQAAGHVFATRGDGEVIVHGWRQWGEACSTGSPACSRSRCGTAPRRSSSSRAITSASSRSTTRAHGGALVLRLRVEGAARRFPASPHAIDLDALALYLECQYIPAPYTVYAAIRKLPAGPLAVVHAAASSRCGAFWQPSYRPKHALSGAAAVDALERELARSVESMLVADVPLGAFVSGGVDSGVVAAMATRRAGRPLDTFNLGFTGRDVGSEHEEAAARRAAHRQPPSLPDGRRRTTCCRRSTAGSTCSTSRSATRRRCRRCCSRNIARREVTVVLTGEGADEVFGGYSNYVKRVSRGAHHRCARRAGLAAARAAAAACRRASRATGSCKAAAEPRARRYTTIPNIFDVLLRGEYFTPAFAAAAAARRIADRAEAFYDECDSPRVPRPPAQRRRAPVAARRSAREGRPRDDGVLAGGARAVSRSRVLRLVRAARSGAEDQRPHAPSSS